METKKNSPLCINIPSTIYPKDTWLRNDEFGRATRKVFYGSPEIRVAEPNYDSLIPNIAYDMARRWADGLFVLFKCT